MGAPSTPGALDPAEGAALASLAVAAVAARLAGDPLDGAAPAVGALQVPGASFVTLKNGGTLRGCIGTLTPVRPLYQDVIRNATQAMADPRLPPVTEDDWPALDVCVAVLSPAEPVACAGRADLVAALRPGVDGLILSQGPRTATFLPVVWEKLASPDRFVAALLTKGGWRDDGWPDGLSVSRYTTAEFYDYSPRTTGPARPGLPDGGLAGWQP